MQQICIFLHSFHRIPEEDQDEKPDKTEGAKEEENGEEKMDVSVENGGDKEKEDWSSSPMLVARDLAKALVQIQKGLEDKFLLPPFGKICFIIFSPVIS